MIVHQNTQVPSRIFRIIESKGEDPSPVLKQMALDLQNLQCNFLAMPCNTTHYCHSAISKSVQISLLSMVEFSVQQLSECHLSKIGVLASPAVKAVGVFEQSFRRSDLKFKFAKNDSSMLNMIKKIKKSKVNKSVVDTFKYKIAELLDDNCDGLLIAWTELSLLHKYFLINTVSVDSLDSEIV
jgi:aspartate racemase